MMQHNLRLLIAEYDRESNDEPLCNIQNVLQLQGCNYNVKVATKTKHETSPPPSFHFTHKSLFEGCYCYKREKREENETRNGMYVLHSTWYSVCLKIDT